MASAHHDQSSVNIEDNLIGREYEGAKWQRPVRRFRVVEDHGDRVTVESIYAPKRRREIPRKRLLSPSHYRLKHLAPGPDGLIPPWPGSRSSGCLNCGPRPETLPLNHNPHPGFGGVYLLKDGEYVDGIVRDDEAAGYEVRHHELIAAADPGHDWRIKVDRPLSDEVYQRHGAGRWVLIEKGLGFA